MDPTDPFAPHSFQNVQHTATTHSLVGGVLVGLFNGYRMYKLTGDTERATRVGFKTLGAFACTIPGLVATIGFGAVAITSMVSTNTGYDGSTPRDLVWLYGPLALASLFTFILGLCLWSSVRADFIQAEIDVLEAEEAADQTVPDDVIDVDAVETIQATYRRPSRKVIMRRH